MFAALTCGAGTQARDFETMARALVTIGATSTDVDIPVRRHPLCVLLPLACRMQRPRGHAGTHEADHCRWAGWVGVKVRALIAARMLTHGLPACWIAKLAYAWGVHKKGALV